MTINGRACGVGETVDAGETMTITAASNPAVVNYTWTDTTSNETSIGRWQSFNVTEAMVGHRSFKVEVCNVIPIPSPYTVCCNIILNITVNSTGKCLP